MIETPKLDKLVKQAKANKIIGESLHDNESYLRYLWINNMGENQKEVYYIPTEAGLPILETGKRK